MTRRAELIKNTIIMEGKKIVDPASLQSDTSFREWFAFLAGLHLVLKTPEWILNIYMEIIKKRTHLAPSTQQHNKQSQNGTHTAPSRRTKKVLLHMHNLLFNN